MSLSESPRIGVEEAEPRFLELLERVALGEEFVITRNGAAIARLVPVQRTTTPDSRRQTIAALRNLSEGKRLDGTTIKELIAEGRR